MGLQRSVSGDTYLLLHHRHRRDWRWRLRRLHPHRLQGRRLRRDGRPHDRVQRVRLLHLIQSGVRLEVGLEGILRHRRQRVVVLLEHRLSRGLLRRRHHKALPSVRPLEG